MQPVVSVRATGYNSCLPSAVSQRVHLLGLIVLSLWSWPFSSLAYQNYHYAHCPYSPAKLHGEKGHHCLLMPRVC